MASGILPKCDFCKETAVYDSKTTFGPWAYMCKAHYVRYGCDEVGLFSVLQPKTVVEKTCQMCEKLKPLTEFYAYSDHNGILRYRTECKTCNLVHRKIAANYNDKKARKQIDKGKKEL